MSKVWISSSLHLALIIEQWRFIATPLAFRRSLLLRAHLWQRWSLRHPLIRWWMVKVSQLGDDGRNLWPFYKPKPWKLRWIWMKPVIMQGLGPTPHPHSGICNDSSILCHGAYTTNLHKDSTHKIGWGLIYPKNNQRWPDLRVHHSVFWGMSFKGVWVTWKWWNSDISLGCWTWIPWIQDADS